MWRSLEGKHCDGRRKRRYYDIMEESRRTRASLDKETKRRNRERRR